MKAIVITRDRASYVHRCVYALARSTGIDEVHIIDHGSTHPLMLDWLDGVVCCSPISNRVSVHLKPNAHPRDIWSNGTLATIVEPDERFIVTDCDVVPENTEGDWVGALHTALTQFPDVIKAGLAFRTDDIPEHYEHRERVIQWESGYVNAANLAGMVGGFAVYRASVDTTLAMYRRLTPEFELDPAVRIGFPYLARHLPWYEDSANLAEELRYYRDHLLPGVSHWEDPDAYVRRPL